VIPAQKGSVRGKVQDANSSSCLRVMKFRFRRLRSVLLMPLLQLLRQLPLIALLQTQMLRQLVLILRRRR
jgi:hypothetical protein